MARERATDRITDEIKRLQRPLRGRLLVSWGLFLAIVAVFIVWPITVPAPSAAPGTRTPPAASTQPAPDSAWDPGPLAAGHQPWANDCKVCHSEPFARVKNKDCLTCHEGIGDHVPTALGEVHGVTDVRCASCHRDHKGPFALASQNIHYTGGACADCHGNIRASYPKTLSEDVSDFALGHPEFRVQLRTTGEAGTLARVRPGEGESLKEPTTLKFPHDVHLAKKGIAHPDGDVVLNCASCHVPAPDGLGFQPVTMRDHCQDCHALRVEPGFSQRELPHGPVKDVLATLREFYAFVGENGGLAPGDGPARGALPVVRPGETSRPPKSFLQHVGSPRERATLAAEELFERNACNVCHSVKRLTGAGPAGSPGADLPQWEIAPVPKDHPFMPKSVFNHAAHAMAECSDCHAAASSEKSEDVLMPRISVCRDCHSGATPAPDKVTSDCGLCHGFHQPARLTLTVGGKTRRSHDAADVEVKGRE